MRNFFRLVLLVLVLTTVFLAAALTSMRVAIHGREVAVPKLIGLTPADAERTAAANGLLLYVENHYYSAAVPEGRILQQLPPAGTRVRRGWRVQVTESLGPQRVTIPNVIGQSPRAAEINLRRRALELGNIVVAHLPDIEPDQVVAQSPPPNSEGVAAPKISLLMSAPPENDRPHYFIMPNFVGQTLGQATNAIAEGGFRLGAVTAVAHSTAPTGALGAPNPAEPKAGAAAPPRSLKPGAFDLVSRQTPAPGQRIAAGATITLEVAK